MDHLGWDEMLGTICGDDTCLIICRDESLTVEVKEKLLSDVLKEVKVIVK